MNRRGHSYTEECDNTCEYANVLSKLKPFGTIDTILKLLKNSPEKGTWKTYSTTMMECSICGKHVAKHKYKYCPECGSPMVLKMQTIADKPVDIEQLTIFND
jgi:DNA-directed RNA polymerase subunit RPC12/RpoP